MSTGLSYTTWALWLFVVSSLCTWTTITSIPPPYNSAYNGCALGTKVLLILIEDAHVYDSMADTWTTLASQPTPRRDLAVLALDSSATAVVVGGYVPAPTVVDVVEEFSLSTGQWTTKTSIPTALKEVAYASDTMGAGWVVGGEDLTPGAKDYLYAYSSALDQWTTRQSMPTARRNFGCAYSVTGNTVFCVGGGLPGNYQTTEMYNVAADVWTTTSSAPTSRKLLYNGLVCTANMFFAIGGLADPTSLEMYDSSTDLWTTLDHSPMSHYKSNAFMVTNAVLVVVGDGPSEHAHAYHTLSATSIVGDPVFTTLTGDVHHLSLHSGVFNLVSAPGLVVNAAIDVLPSLPAEENTVVVMVAVVAALESGVLMAYCSISSANLTECAVSDKHSMLMTKTEHTFSLALRNFTVEIRGVCLSVLDVGSSPVRSYLPSAYLDVHFHHSPGRPKPRHGLLPMLEALPKNGHTFDIGTYEVPNGDLFALFVPATVGVFDARF